MPAASNVDDFAGLDSFATPRQLEILKVVRDSGSMREASRRLNTNISIVARAIQSAKLKAASKGWAPSSNMTRVSAEGFKVKRHSANYVDGQLKQEWVINEPDKEQAEKLLRAFVEAATESVKGLHKPVKAPIGCEKDLLTVYPLGDAHFGLYSWAKETGVDFDLKMAEAATCEAIDRLITTAPKSHTALFVNLGDFFHADNSDNQTPHGGHALDVDTRYALVLQTGFKALIYCIKRLLERHERVIVWNMKGNHDPHSSFALAMALSAYFHNEPRVEVDMGPGEFKYLEFGKVLLGSHHGHSAKFSDLGGVMADDQAEAWGRTKHRYWYCGHIHHKYVDKEQRGVMVETFRTLAARDAWHMSKGYRAGRDMYAITHHKDHGEIMRTRCDIGMLQGVQSPA